MSSRRPRLLFIALTLLLTATAVLGAAQVDNEAPTVSIEQPEEGQTVNGTVEIAGTADDPDGNVSHVEVRIDSGNWSNATGANDWTDTWDTRNGSDGNHTIHARSHDGETYSQTATRNVTVANEASEENSSQGSHENNTSPSVTIHIPEEGATVGGTVDIEGEASDSDGNVSEVRVRIDDADWQTAEGTSPWSFSWDSTTSEDGEHTITVEAVDDHNATATDQRNVTVDNQNDQDNETSSENGSPAIAIETPTEGDTVNGTVLVEGTASDPDGDVASVEVRVDDASWQTAEGTSEWSHEWDASTASPGDHRVEARAQDDEGATSHATVNVTIPEEEEEPSQTEPNVSIVAPGAGDEVNGTVGIRGTASDPDGSIERVEVRVGDGGWQPVQGTEEWSFEWDAGDAEPGMYLIEARAFDDNGNVANAQQQIQLTEAEPLASSGVSELVLELTSPDDGQSVEDELELAGEVTGVEDANVTIRVVYRIDDRQWNALELPGGGSFEETVNVSDLQEGDHDLSVRAVHGDETSDMQTSSFTIESGGERAGPTAGLVLGVIALLLLGGLVLWARQ